jgi:hypothetical protein
MANTYEAIATVTVTGATAADMEFTSIPATYTDLVLKLSGRTNRTGDTNADIGITFNGNTSNYSLRDLYGTGSAAGSRLNPAGTSNIGNIFATAVNSTVNTFSNFEMYIPNYLGSTNKSVSIDTTNETNATGNWSLLVAGLWSNTSAITSITLTPLNSDSFVQYSTATLYGIKNS